MKKLTVQNTNHTVPALDIFDMVFKLLYPKNSSEDFISCELDGDTVEVSTYDDLGRYHKMTISYEVDPSYSNKVLMAEQQLTGYEIGKTSGDIIELIEQMGLTKREWMLIKGKHPNIINGLDADYIYIYFESKKD